VALVSRTETEAEQQRWEKRKEKEKENIAAIGEVRFVFP
jgi:hypothetical protein